VDFSFTRVDEHRAVVFGGYQPEAGTVSDTYILDMETWVGMLKSHSSTLIMEKRIRQTTGEEVPDNKT